MNRKLPLPLALSLLCTAPLLQSCATEGLLALKITPTMTVRHSTENPYAYYQLGKYFQSGGLHQQAADAYAKALAADPNHLEARNALGTAHATLRQFDAAEADFQAAIEQMPRAAYLHNNLGYAYFLQERYAEAVAAFETAVQLEPNNRRTWNNLGMALARTGEQTRSHAAFAQALALAEGQSGQAAATANLALAVPKDRGVIGTIGAPAAETTPPAPTLAATNGAGANDDASLDNDANLASRTPAGEATQTAQAGNPPQRLELSIAAGTEHSLKLIPQTAETAPLAKFELHQQSTQVFELRAAQTAPSLPVTLMVADLPTRYRNELQQPAVSNAVATTASVAIKQTRKTAGSAKAAAAPASSPIATTTAKVTSKPETPAVAKARVADFQSMLAAARPSLRSQRYYRLELANGNGIKGFARRMNETLVALGAPQSILSDQRPFGQPRTEIHYRHGYAGVAKTLGQQLANIQPILVKSNDLRTEIRIVLGRDLARQLALQQGSTPSLLISDAIMNSPLAEILKNT